jgi:hypothetical protein
VPKWSWQKKQERTELDWAGAFARSLKGGEKEAQDQLFLPFPSFFEAMYLGSASFAMPKWAWQKKQERTEEGLDRDQLLLLGPF